MNRRLVTIGVIVLMVAAVLWAAHGVDLVGMLTRLHGFSPASNTAGQSHALQKDVTIPFEIVNNTIYLRVMVGHPKPLWFVFDTGDKYAIIDLATAKSLGLDLEGQIPVHGAGNATIAGSYVRNSAFSVVGLDGFTQPLFMAIPLHDLAQAFGHEFDGILGFDFISQFVVDVDYSKKTLTLHDKEHYQYSGPGESFPTTFDRHSGHPHVRAQIIENGRAPMEGTFAVDVGSSGALILHKPFVDQEHLPQSNQATIPFVGGRGVGGSVQGTVGRMKGLKLGHFLIDNPVTVFSQATNGAYASTVTEGTIGGDILRKFNLILDYSRNRIILEPNSHFSEPLEYDMSGFHLLGQGQDYKEYKIDAIIDNSPASQAGLREGDMLFAINGHPAAEYTLSQIREMFKQEKKCDLSIERGGARLQVKLKLRRLI